MMEYWKVEDPVFSGIGFKKISRFMNTFHLLVKRSVVNIPLPHFSRTHYSLRGVGYEPEAIQEKNPLPLCTLCLCGEYRFSLIYIA